MSPQITRMPQGRDPLNPTPPPAPPPPSATPPKAPVAPASEGTGDEKFQEFVVLLDDQAIDKVNKAFTMPVGPKRREYVFKTLYDNTRATQEPLWNVLQGLQAAGHVAQENGYTPLWIENAIIVRGDDTARTTLESAANVGHVVESKRFSVRRPDLLPEDDTSSGSGGGKGKDDPQWNITRVNAEKAWKDGLTGKGTTVAVIDTGVDVTHPALLTNFRGYDPATGNVDITGNWFDSTGESPDKMVDDDGHGTHVTGTTVGTDGRTNKIGVAPDAQWFGIRGLGAQGGTDGMLLRAFQYAVAPLVPAPGTASHTRRDLSLGADVLANSWGSPDGMSNVYLPALRNLAAMGVVTLFAAGNEGQGGVSSSVGSPASSAYSIAVGASDKDDKPAHFSSRGPNPMQTNPNEEPTPFIAAPGVDVRSSVPGGMYERLWQGTSMAQPAAAGAALLTLQAAKELTGAPFDVYGVRDVFKKIARDVGPKGADTGTGHGVIDLSNLRQAVRDVAIARGLLNDDGSRIDKKAKKSAPVEQARDAVAA